MGMGAKLFFLGGFFLLIVGVISAASVAMAGNRNMKDGTDTLQCQAATLVDVSLSGRKGNFRGLLGLMENLDDVLDVLDENSAFMVGLRSLLDQTEGIER